MVLSFETFSVEAAHDSLKVWDGVNPFEGSTLIADLSGLTKPAPVVVDSGLKLTSEPHA